MSDATYAAASVASARRQAWRTAIGIVLIGVAVYCVMPTLPLYSENQNTKFFYGLAKAGVGRLASDWLFQQGSALPIFDALVFVTRAFIGEWGFYVWQIAAVIAYTAGVYGIARTVGLSGTAGLGPDRSWFLPVFGLWFVGLNTTHATMKAFDGVAHQYLNGPVFEPQSFGILALIALLLFRLRQTGWAVVLVVAAAWVHPVYSISGVMILSGMAAARWRFGGDVVRLPAAVLAGGLLGCLAAAAFAYSLLQPSDPVVQAQAIDIITQTRIPDHSLPEVWFDADCMIKLAVMAFVIWLAWRDPLGWVLLVVTVSVVASTLWVWLGRDMALALAAPWRASAIIMPAANAILLGRLIQSVAAWSGKSALRRKLALAANAVPLAVAIGFGIQNKAEFAEAAQRPAYFDWVRETARDGDQFVTPVDEMAFRLSTGQPQYASWKTHPHRGPAVLEWYERVHRAHAVTRADQPSCAALEALAMDGVTHLVRKRPTGDPHCAGWRVVYEDADHVVSQFDRARAQ
jgi:hypothetical protein